ncbi:MAG: cytochrome C [Rhodospirillaceae bacterium]|nr:cytochrome C [Rhodospirillaceae bacterium]MBL6930993.1 cytochrome C [Rhodospirillales bacterium]MBL6942666.1 cytochrome C [Rhodospirillales bacterium]
MKIDKNTLKSKMGRRKALALLGLATMAAYATPTLMKLNPAAASGGAASGGGMDGGASGGGNLLATDATVIKECSECHMPYSPRLLPSSSWRKMMGNLDSHFGEDASLNKATRTKIENYLVSNSGRGGDGPLRISQLNWFRHEHKGDVTKHKAKSWSNCLACHRQ